MKRLVVIDDDRTFCETLQDVLGAEGFTVRFATDGPAGVTLVREWRPDLVICDLHMEGPSGFDVLQALRRDRQTASVPIVFLTADRSEGTHRLGMELGADDFLPKSSEFGTLLRAVDARLAHRASIRRESERRIADMRATISHSMPHEFLTPLSAILGLSSLLAEEGGSYSSDATHEAVETILDAARRLRALIEKFLQFAELEALLAEVPPPHSPLADISSAAADAAREQAGRLGRSNDLVVTVSPGAWAALSGEHAASLVGELVENACIFSAPGTQVRVTLAPDASQLTLIVEDRGRGMTPEQVGRCEAFVQFERRRFEQPGMGLGLAIVHRIVSLAEGTLHIESALGEGTTVTIRLPRHQPGKEDDGQ